MKKDKRSKSAPSQEPINDAPKIGTDFVDSPVFSVSTPTAGNAYGVSYNSGGGGSSGSGGSGSICEVRGNVNASIYTLGGIWVLNRDTPLASNENDLLNELLSEDNEVSNISNDDWSKDQQVFGYLEGDGSDKTNYFAAVAYFYENSGSGGPPPSNHILIGPFGWTATASDCSKSIKAEVSKARLTMAARVSAPVDVIPSKHAPGWLQYKLKLEKLVESRWRLMLPRGTGPLHANELHVFANRVEWKPSPTRPFVIRGPIGILDSRDFDHVNGQLVPFRFPGLPKFCVVAHHQGDAEIRHPITATSRAGKQTISVASGRDILISVNDNMRSMVDNEGKIELWVKILS